MKSGRSERGFTTTEVAVSTMIFGLVSTSLVTMTKTGDHQADQVMRESTCNKQLRKAADVLIRDLRPAKKEKLVISNDAKGGTILVLQKPVQVTGGQIVWGAAGKPNWYFRYVVLPENHNEIEQQIATGTPTPLPDYNGRLALKKQLMNPEWKVKGERRLLGGMEPGGFVLQPSGDMWHIVFSLAAEEGRPARKVEFDVGLKN